MASPSQGDELPVDANDDEKPSPDESLAAIGWTFLLFALGAAFLVQSLSIRTQAAVWPRGLAILLIALTGLKLILSVRRRWLAARTADNPAVGRPVAAAVGTPSDTVRRRVFTAGWLLVYCLVAQYLGFGPTMLVMLPLYMWVCGYRRPVWIAAITIGSAVAMTLLFETVANVPIWEGRL